MVMDDAAVRIVEGTVSEMDRRSFCRRILVTSSVWVLRRSPLEVVTSRPTNVVLCGHFTAQTTARATPTSLLYEAHWFREQDLDQQTVLSPRQLQDLSYGFNQSHVRELKP